MSQQLDDVVIGDRRFARITDGAQLVAETPMTPALAAAYREACAQSAALAAGATNANAMPLHAFAPLSPVSLEALSDLIDVRPVERCPVCGHEKGRR